MLKCERQNVIYENMKSHIFKYSNNIQYIIKYNDVCNSIINSGYGFNIVIIKNLLPSLHWGDIEKLTYKEFICSKQYKNTYFTYEVSQCCKVLYLFVK